MIGWKKPSIGKLNHMTTLLIQRGDSKTSEIHLIDQKIFERSFGDQVLSMKLYIMNLTSIMMTRWFQMIILSCWRESGLWISRWFSLGLFKESTSVNFIIISGAIIMENSLKVKSRITNHHEARTTIYGASWWFVLEILSEFPYEMFRKKTSSKSFWASKIFNPSLNSEKFRENSYQL